MFESLSDRFSSAIEGLTRKGAISEEDVAAAMREVRISLLESDVSLPVVRSFTRAVKRRATGQAVLRSVTPAQQVIKIVHDELVEVLSGEDAESAELRVNKPLATVMMVGLQGSGKTTTTAKIGKMLTQREGKKVMMASLDTRRPAAMEQLQVLGVQAGVKTLPILTGHSALEIAKRAKQAATFSNYDVLLLDTAGRLHVDEELMMEMTEIHSDASPRETLLVVDGLTGQDAVNVAQAFTKEIGISGIVLTRMEGDGRGGAALSMRAVTGKPIKFIGTGEKLDDLQQFDPSRIAGTILGMGDIVSLVEKAAETFEMEKMQRSLRRFGRGRYNMNDFRLQLEAVQKMGGVHKLLSMMPNSPKMAKPSDELVDDMEVQVRRQIALICSMTRKERANPRIIHASRKRRIAAGAGLKVSDVNSLLKAQRQVADMGKRAAKKGLLKQVHAFATGQDFEGIAQGMSAPSPMQQRKLSSIMQPKTRNPRFRRRR
ncbi:MAG: signal recognition particle protein [Rhodobacteraceae bacterium]|nr:signal recognition particle protein [Paracoccaceae bacterium]